MTSIVCHSGVSAPTRENSTSATSISELPTIGKIRYRPVRAMTWPETIEPVMMPMTNGISSRPPLVGLAPFTICRYSGSGQQAAEHAPCRG